MPYILALYTKQFFRDTTLHSIIMKTNLRKRSTRYQYVIRPKVHFALELSSMDNGHCGRLPTSWLVRFYFFLEHQTCVYWLCFVCALVCWQYFSCVTVGKVRPTETSIFEFISFKAPPVFKTACQVINRTTLKNAFQDLDLHFKTCISRCISRSDSILLLFA